MANFSSCDLCFESLRTFLMDIQISPGTVVQLSDEGDVVHRPNGLRDYRLCGRCGGYLRDVMRTMTSTSRPVG